MTSRDVLGVMFVAFGGANCWLKAMLPPDIFDVLAIRFLFDLAAITIWSAIMLIFGCLPGNPSFTVVFLATPTVLTLLLTPPDKLGVFFLR